MTQMFASGEKNLAVAALLQEQLTIGYTAGVVEEIYADGTMAADLAIHVERDDGE